MKRSLIGAVLIGSLALGACGGDDTDAGDAGDEAEAARPLGLDAGFGTGGIAAVPLSATDPDRVTAVALAPDGTIYTAGFQNVGGDQRLAVARIGTDGELDTTFGTGGVATVNASVGKTAELARSVVVQSTGKVVVAGTAEHDAAAAGDAARDTDIVAARFDATGKLDTTFGTAGVARIDLGAGRAISATAFTGDNAWGMANLAGDKLAIFGTKLASGADRTDADFALVGLTSAGVLDTSFGTGGSTVVDVDTGGDSARNVNVLGGKILATGYTRSGDGVVSPVLIRTSLDGKLDTTFGTGGVANHTVLAGVAESYQVGLQGSDYVMAGYGRGADAGEKVDLVAFRFTADGAWDPTFGTAGVTRVDVAGDDDRARDLEVLPDGRIMIVGSGKQTAAKVQPMVVLLDEDGAPVTDFGTGGRILSDFGGPADSWYGITLSEDEEQAYLVGYKGVDANSGGNDDAVVGRVNL